MSQTGRKGVLGLLILLAGLGIVGPLIVSDGQPFPALPPGIERGMWPLASALLIGVCWTVYDSYLFTSARRREEHRVLQAKRGLCPTCGYDVRENEEVCSECGEPLPRELVERPQTPAIRRIIRSAIREARQSGMDHVGTQHVLLALLNDQESVAAAALSSFGVTDEQLRKRLNELE